ncbi:hypothetical protein D307_gp160 [Bacillus phage Bastille]|uniref:Uncharacterized protein n=4 Tax=Bastillevirus TaxID=1918010 RepID=J9PKJ1_9CAUD|nr:hypothetical protein D307_gp160 [Bacillus phage Bastille]YP_009035365.1 hypothetical protein FP73_gp173 [Bacillus phage Hoody T]YP_009037074.1 hypothetical protein FP74_gp188 [Bacillus phage CAM003]ASU01024.1 hypothetical protein ANTHONY_184 [Bacillus phage Anthony]AEQ34304.1 hypothetical protein [Bacillus phage Bastille]AHZ09608.1 hypothetical protein [Bacillus phage CAM003]AHZ10480.1 hypothetical protein [Bacillus phage Hoody T]
MRLDDLEVLLKEARKRGATDSSEVHLGTDHPWNLTVETVFIDGDNDVVLGDADAFWNFLTYDLEEVTEPEVE